MYTHDVTHWDILCAHSNLAAWIQLFFFLKIYHSWAPLTVSFEGQFLFSCGQRGGVAYGEAGLALLTLKFLWVSEQLTLFFFLSKLHIACRQVRLWTTLWETLTYWAAEHNLHVIMDNVPIIIGILCVFSILTSYMALKMDAVTRDMLWDTEGGFNTRFSSLNLGFQFYFFDLITNFPFLIIYNSCICGGWQCRPLVRGVCKS